MANKTKKSSFKLIMDLVTILLGGLFWALLHFHMSAMKHLRGLSVAE